MSVTEKQPFPPLQNTQNSAIYFGIGNWKWSDGMQIQPGLWQHFKGNLYRVQGIALHSETGEEMVVYQALYGEHGLWVRPASMWLEQVEREGYSGPRFIRVGD